MSHDQPLKAFHDNECECYGMTDIKAGYGGFFGIGIMVAVLKHIGITDCARKMLKMSVRTTVGWVKHHFSIQAGDAICVSSLNYLQSHFFFFTSAAMTKSIWSSGGGSPGVLGSFGYM